MAETIHPLSFKMRERKDPSALGDKLFERKKERKKKKDYKKVKGNGKEATVRFWLTIVKPWLQP